MVIEEKLRAFIMDKADIECFFEEPELSFRPDKYYIVEKLGGSERNHLTTAQFAVQSYAPSMLEAMAMNHAVIEVLKGFSILDSVCRCARVSDYNFTDTQTHRYRYQAIFNVTYYEE